MEIRARDVVLVEVNLEFQAEPPERGEITSWHARLSTSEAFKLMAYLGRSLERDADKEDSLPF